MSFIPTASVCADRLRVPTASVCADRLVCVTASGCADRFSRIASASAFVQTDGYRDGIIYAREAIWEQQRGDYSKRCHINAHIRG